jgi:hypothetical protein
MFVNRPVAGDPVVRGLVPAVDDDRVEAVMTRVCPQCGFDFALGEAAALDVVANAPSRFAHAFAGREGPRYGAAGTWSPREYLWHVIDVLRHGTENFWMLALDPDAGLGPWREHDLMAARSASPMSVRVGLWALAVGVGEWNRSAHEAPPDVSAWHPDQGWVNRGHVLRWTAHELVHHEADIRWGLA